MNLASPSRSTTALAPARDTALQAYLAPLRELLDLPGVTDLCINRPHEAFVEQDGVWQCHTIPALGFEHLQAFARALATFTGQHVDEQHPLLSATLPQRTGSDGQAQGGERVQVVGPPAVTAHTVGICIRKPSLKRTTLHALAKGRLHDVAQPQPVAAPGDVAQPKPPGGLFSRPLRDTSRLDPVDEELLEQLQGQRVEDFLRLAVRKRRTIVVAGRTGCGKTTLMRALTEEIAAEERLITIEDAAELFLPRHANALHLFFSRGEQGAAKLTPTALLEACLRLRPDRILLAEVRGEEAFSFLRLAASGHPGSLTSVHAGSAELAFDQIALMARQSPAGKGLTLPELQALARSVIDIVVHLDVDAQGRHVSGIHFDPLSRLRGTASNKP